MTCERFRFLVSFLGTIDYVLSNATLLNGKSQPTFEKIDTQQLQEMCQLCLQQLQSCMFYTESETLGTSHLSDELIFKLSLIVLMSVEQLKAKKTQLQPPGKAQLNAYFTVVAFALVFFSHLIDHAVIRLDEVLMAAHTNRMMQKVKLGDDEGDSVDEKHHDEVSLVALVLSVQSCLMLVDQE